MSIHSEPAKKGWRSAKYKSAGAAKAGITRTIKFYEAAKTQVAEAVANGGHDYHAPMYYAFRDATDTTRGRTHVADPSNYVVMGAEEYKLVEPKVKRTNLMTGETYFESINTPNFLSVSSETYWSA